MQFRAFQLLILGVLVFGSTTLLSAKDISLTDYAYGEIVRVHSGEIVLKEYDAASGQSVETVYAISAEVRLQNVNALTDLTAGQNVYIDYVTKNGQKHADLIELETESAVSGENSLSLAAEPSGEVF